MPASSPKWRGVHRRDGRQRRVGVRGRRRLRGGFAGTMKLGVAVLPLQSCLTGAATDAQRHRMRSATVGCGHSYNGTVRNTRREGVRVKRKSTSRKERVRASLPGRILIAQPVSVRGLLTRSVTEAGVCSIRICRWPACPGWPFSHVRAASPPDPVSMAPFRLLRCRHQPPHRCALARSRIQPRRR